MNNDIIANRYVKAMERFNHSNLSNVITHNIIKHCFCKRPQDSHKGTCGRLFVCAGSKGLTGAAIMACKSALRCGCGLVTLGCPDSLNNIFEIALTEVMTLPLADINGLISYDSYESIYEFSKKCDAFLLGPGLAKSSDINKLTSKILEECTVPLIIDADGLNAVAHNPEILKKSNVPVIITPHIGEFSRLTGLDSSYIIKNRNETAIEFAANYNVIVVLKSHRTIVANPDGTLHENILGSPAMATGGSGDVLAGAIASLTAQGNLPYLASLAGVYIHSLAADMAVQETGEYSLIPGDIIEYIKYAVRETAYRS